MKEQLREAIRGSGKSLNQLSGVIGIGRDRLSRFLRGERSLSLDAAERICNALQLQLNPADVREGPPPAEPAKRPRRKKGDA